VFLMDLLLIPWIKVGLYRPFLHAAKHNIIMGQQLRARIKRRRRKNYLTRKKELAKSGLVRKSVRVKAAPAEAKATAKKAPKKSPAKKAAKAEVVAETAVTEVAPEVVVAEAVVVTETVAPDVVVDDVAETAEPEVVTEEVAETAEPEVVAEESAEPVTPAVAAEAEPAESWNSDERVFEKEVDLFWSDRIIPVLKPNH